MKKKTLLLAFLILFTFGSTKVNAEQIIRQDFDVLPIAELEETINQMTVLEKDMERNLIERIYYKVQEKFRIVETVVGVAENQYQMKKDFTQNSAEVYRLTADVKKNSENLKQEIKYIIKDSDRTITPEDYANIRQGIDSLKNDIAANEYIAGSIAKETTNYFRFVKQKQFIKANRSFEKILTLQEEQIELLNIIDNHIKELNIVLKEVSITLETEYLLLKI